MSVSSDFYRDRAAECAVEASGAKLDNVRDRARRSEAAWLAMADRLTRSETLRSKAADEKRMVADAEQDIDAELDAQAVS